MNKTPYNKYSKIYTSSGIWEDWHNKTFEDFDDKFYSNKIQEFIDKEEKKNIILYGNNGTGKTLLLNLAMKELLHKNKTVYVIDFRNLVREYISSWRDTGKLSELLAKDYLAIDDLGKEFNNGGVSKELAVTTLDYVLRYRVQRQRPTWITFNLKLNEVKPIYGKHISSLIKRSSIALAFDGDDYGDKLFKKITR